MARPAPFAASLLARRAAGRSCARGMVWLGVASPTSPVAAVSIRARANGCARGIENRNSGQEGKKRGSGRTSGSQPPRPARQAPFAAVPIRCRRRTGLRWCGPTAWPDARPFVALLICDGRRIQARARGRGPALQPRFALLFAVLLPLRHPLARATSGASRRRDRSALPFRGVWRRPRPDAARLPKPAAGGRVRHERSDRCDEATATGGEAGTTLRPGARNGGPPRPAGQSADPPAAPGSLGIRIFYVPGRSRRRPNGRRGATDADAPLDRRLRPT